MAQVHKFEFGLSFDQLHGMGLPGRDDEPVTVPSYSDEEMDAARKLAFIDGKRIGEDQAQQSLERRLCDATDNLVQHFAEFVSEQQRIIAGAEHRAAEIMLNLMQKLFPVLIERSGTAEIEQMLAQVFSQSIEQQRVVVRCPEALHNSITSIAAGVAAKAGFDGNLVVIADPSQIDDDCRIEWAEGGVERAPRRMLEQVERAIHDNMAALDRRIGRASATPLNELTEEFN